MKKIIGEINLGNDSLGHYEIERVLSMNKDNADEIAISIINNKGKSLTPSNTISILELTNDKHRIIEAIINAKGNSITPNEMLFFSWYDKDRLEELKQMLSKYFSPDIINKNVQNWEVLDAQMKSKKFHIAETILRINVRKSLNKVFK